MSRRRFEEQSFYSNEIFIFVDDNFPLQDRVQKIENGMYACIYTEDFDEEQECAAKLLEYCKRITMKSVEIISVKRSWKCIFLMSGKDPCICGFRFL